MYFPRETAKLAKISLRHLVSAEPSHLRRPQRQSCSLSIRTAFANFAALRGLTQTVIIFASYAKIRNIILKF